MRARFVLAIAVCGALFAACASPDSAITVTRARSQKPTPLITTAPPATADRPPNSDGPPSTDDEPPVTEAPNTIPNSMPVEPGIIDFGSNKEPKDYDGFLVAMFKDVQSWWTDEYPQIYGTAYEQLSGGIYAAYRARTEPIPGCGEPTTAYDDVRMNAFYCTLGDFMAYDDEELLPKLVGDLGQTSVGIVLAHEFGHAIQSRSGNWTEPVILKENQADCFAGAWAAHVYNGENSEFRFNDNDVRGGMVAMLMVADRVENSGVRTQSSHGTGFDRVGAFQDGFLGGAERCYTFFTENREDVLLKIPFDYGDENQGNLPTVDPTGQGNDILTLIPRDLTDFWTPILQASGGAFAEPAIGSFDSDGPYPDCPGIDTSTFRGSGGYCEATNTIYYDVDAVDQLVPRIGDMALGYILSNGYSGAAQVALGSGLTGERRVLANDCLTGAWVADIVPDDSGSAKGGRGLILSAGDLDEAIQTVLIVADPTATTDINGSAFEKVDSFRAGVLGGISACTARFG